MKPRVFTSVFASALAAAICWSQVATGNLRGTISDSPSERLPNCAVPITQASAGLVRKVLTNELGDFSAPSRPVGESRIAAGLAGFQTKVLSAVTPQVDQTAIEPIVLEPGAVSQVVAKRRSSAEAEWTFSPEFAELVWSDWGKERQVIEMKGMAPFSSHRFRVARLMRRARSGCVLRCGTQPEMVHSRSRFTSGNA